MPNGDNEEVKHLNFQEDISRNQQHEPEIVRPSTLRIDTSPPIITYLLLTINVIMWVVEESQGGSGNIDVLIRMGAKVNGLIAQGEYWRLLTPIFLHGSFEHLLFNSLALYLWGRYIEGLFGKVKYLGIYILAGLAGSLASYIMSPSVSIGASGAIFGLFGTLLYFRARQRELYNKIFGIQVVIIIGLNLFNGFVQPGIDNWGHVGGLIGGFLAAHAVGLLGENELKVRKVLAGILLVCLFAGGLLYGGYRQ